MIERVGSAPTVVMSLNAGSNIFSRTYVETVVGAAENVDVVWHKLVASTRSRKMDSVQEQQRPSTVLGAPFDSVYQFMEWPAMSERLF